MAIGILVKEIMSKPVLTIESKKTVQEAAKKMATHRVGAIIVTEGENPIGIITETDINKRVVAHAKNPKKLKSREIMSSPIAFISPDADIIDAVEKMKTHRIKRLPVIKRGKLVGMLSNTDIARTTPELLDILTSRLKMREEIPRFEQASTSGMCENCGNFSEDLRFQDEQWLCEECR